MAIRWMNLGKLPETKLAKYMYKHNISQKTLSEFSRVSTATISRLCKYKAVGPNVKTANKILKALDRLVGKKHEYTDFWI